MNYVMNIGEASQVTRDGGWRYYMKTNVSIIRATYQAQFTFIILREWCTGVERFISYECEIGQSPSEIGALEGGTSASKGDETGSALFTPTTGANQRLDAFTFDCFFHW